VTTGSAGSFDPHGPVAEAMADLWWLMLVLGVVVFVVFAVVLWVGLFRRRPGETGEEPIRSLSTRFGRWFLIGGVALPLVILIVVFGATVQAMRATPAEAPPGALVIEITGHQWWYEVHYPDHGITTANELHMPVGQPVAFQLTSADVIHSFWVPALGGKRDLLPEDRNTLVLQADEAGEFRSQCAEFCGLQHTKMGILVVAEPEQAFRSWVADQQQPAAEPTSAAARRGQDVFFAADCATCHAVAGTSADGSSAPDLTHLASRDRIGAGAVPNTPDELARWITDPESIKAGSDMPATPLGADELQDLLAYLGSLQ
jgi:cytochrome c oxidase subunit 2